MDVERVKAFDLDWEGILWEGIELSFVNTPIVFVEPVVDETFNFGERRAVSILVRKV